MSVTFTEDRKVWDQILKQFESLKSEPNVEVGLPEGKTDSNVVMYASANHFGVPGHIPPRPFIALAIDNNKPAISKMQDLFMGAILDRKMSVEKALGLLGEAVKNMIVSLVDSDYFKSNEPNALSTINRKGSTRPLVNTRHMLQSLTYVVKKNV